MLEYIHSPNTPTLIRMAPGPLHSPPSQSTYSLSQYEESYPPHQTPVYPPLPAPQATRATSGRNLPGSTAQARSGINTPSTLPPPPTHMNSHFSPSSFTPPHPVPSVQPSPMPYSHPPPGYEVSDPFDQPRHLEPSPSGGHLATWSVAQHIQQSPPVLPGSIIRPQPSPLDVESLSLNLGRRRDSRRSSELHHSPTPPTSPGSTRSPNSAVPSTGSNGYEIFLNDVSTDNFHAPKESAVSMDSCRRGRTRVKVKPFNWSKLSRPWGKEKTKAPKLVNGQSATSFGSEPLILSTLGEGQQMNIDTFCNAYSLPDTILHLFRESAITGTHAFSDITKTDLTEMGFKIGEIIDLKRAVKKWASEERFVS